MDIAYWIQTYGYIALFLCTLLEGETAVALAGFAVFQGYLTLPGVFLVALVGSVLGDQAGFLLGKYRGKEFFTRYPKLAAQVARVHLPMEKYQNWFIFGMRYMYGMRIALPIAMGTSKITFLRFSLLNILSAVIWVTIFIFLGFTYGSTIHAALGRIRQYEGLLALALVLAVFIAQHILWRRNRMLQGGDK